MNSTEVGGDARPAGGFVTGFCWFCTILGSLAVAATLADAFQADSAPKQGAAAAMAATMVVIPYCLARAVSELVMLTRWKRRS